MVADGGGRACRIPSRPCRRPGRPPPRSGTAGARTKQAGRPAAASRRSATCGRAWEESFRLGVDGGASTPSLRGQRGQPRPGWAARRPAAHGSAAQCMPRTISLQAVRESPAWMATARGPGRRPLSGRLRAGGKRQNRRWGRQRRFCHQRRSERMVEIKPEPDRTGRGCAPGRPLALAAWVVGMKSKSHAGSGAALGPRPGSRQGAGREPAGGGGRPHAPGRISGWEPRGGRLAGGALSATVVK